MFVFVFFYTMTSSTVDGIINEGVSSFIVWDYFGFWLIWIVISISVVSLIACIDTQGSRKERLLTILIATNIFIMIVLVKCSSIVSFYIIFELAAIPILVIIIGWGRQPEKLKASFFIFFFTMVSSAPLLAMILNFFYMSSSPFVRFINLGLWQESNYLSSVFGGLLLLRIMSKIPIFGLHNWLPKAHVEAPVYGSIILAGILLKLGGLGAIRVWFLINSIGILNLIRVISLLGVFIISFIVLTKTDIKQIVAFRSVVHIAIPIIILGLRGSSRIWLLLITLISHAFSSSGIFFIVYYFYLARGSRNLIIMKGNANFYKPMKLLWLLVIIARLGGPPFFNLIIELLRMELLIIYYAELAFVIILPCLIICVFHIFLYTRVGQGKTTEFLHVSRPVSSAVFLIISTRHVILALLSSIVLIKM